MVKAEIIPNDAGVPKTPCVVAFTKEGELVGDAANHPDLEPETLVVEVALLLALLPSSSAALGVTDYFQVDI